MVDLPHILPGSTVVITPPDSSISETITYDPAVVKTINESKWKSYWRPAAAVVYLIIIIVDFIVMPIAYEINDSFNPVELVSTINTIKDPSVQIAAINSFTSKRIWSSLTVQGGGMLHIAFGAILGIAAWTRGKEKEAFAKQGTHIKASRKQDMPIRERQSRGVRS